MYGIFFSHIEAFNYYLWKMRRHPQFSFHIPITLAKICFSRIVKNISVFVDTVLKKKVWNQSDLNVSVEWGFKQTNKNMKIFFRGDGNVLFKQ